MNYKEFNLSVWLNLFLLIALGMSACSANKSIYGEYFLEKGDLTVILELRNDSTFSYKRLNGASSVSTVGTFKIEDSKIIFNSIPCRWPTGIPTTDCLIFSNKMVGMEKKSIAMDSYLLEKSK